jgi:Putative prokaryotic signal transducing protein
MNDEELQGLAAEYGVMSELELMKLARDYDELGDGPQALLRQEFRKRGLQPPLRTWEPPPPTDLARLVTVAQYRDMAEAFVARAVLEGAGIECFLQDENTVRMEWLWSNYIGGMRLKVLPEDEAEARELLSGPPPENIPLEGQPDFNQPVCPRCGSEDVVLNDPGRKPRAGTMLCFWSIFYPLAFPLLALGLIGGSRSTAETWRCLRCKCRWVDDGQLSGGSESAA